MSMRWIVIALVLGVAALAYVAWNGSSQRAQQQQAEAPAPEGMPPSGEMGGMPSAEAQDPGITWEKPAAWTDQGPRSMRLATYSVPASGGAGTTECAVYYFGPGQGGGTDANLDRWVGEFENPGSPERSSGTINGIRVSRVRVKGTYRAHAGMGQDEAPAAANHELLGAIAEGPGGSVFFKLTGPASTVDAAYADFDRMVRSVKKK
jgi:hypothetical protein